MIYKLIHGFPKAVSFFFTPGQSFYQTCVRDKGQAFHIWLYKLLHICKSPELMGGCGAGEGIGTFGPELPFIFLNQLE